MIYIGKGEIEKIELSGDIEIGTTEDLKTWTNQDIVIEITWPENAEYYKKQVSIDGGNTWKEYRGAITVGENTKVITKVEDNAGNEIKKATLEINKIDKEKPTVEVSPNGGNGYVMPIDSNGVTGKAMIKAKLTAIDEGGSELKTLQYAWNQNAEREPTSWTNFTNEQEVAKTDITTAGTWYLWTNVIDTAGNRATEIQTSEGFVVSANTEAEYIIKLMPDYTDWTANDITVTATYGENLTPISLSCTGTNATDYTVNGTTSIVIKSNNQTVTATAVDKAGNVVTATLNVTKIDKNAPIVTATVERITVMEGESNDVKGYFTYSENGGAPITSIEYIDTSNNNEPVQNTNTLAPETEHIIRCVVTKETGKSEYAELSISVELPLITTATSIKNVTKNYKDELGNKVVVPGGFKVRTDLATIVEHGIVIEDKDQNQFVWVPNGNINKSDGTTITIELARYSFDDSTGKPSIHQKASEYASVVTIAPYHQELATSRISDGSTTNTTALNLAEFVSKSSANGGYGGFYIGRYEASSRTMGCSLPGVAPIVNITQPDAAIAARTMYNGNPWVVSDLANSYMWDTTVVFIQECSSDTSYSLYYDAKGRLYDTGGTGERCCNIYDLKGNVDEWTTEFSNAGGNPCVDRGGGYGSYQQVRHRGACNVSGTYSDSGFRVALYVL